jgi:hypothetical protein
VRREASREDRSRRAESLPMRPKDGTWKGCSEASARCPNSLLRKRFALGDTRRRLAESVLGPRVICLARPGKVGAIALAVLRIVLPIFTAALIATVVGCGGGGNSADVTVTETVPATESEGPTSEVTRQEIYDAVRSLRTGGWMHTFEGVRVETDTAELFFNTFKRGSSIDDINSLPEDALCRYVLNRHFPGIEHVQIIEVEGGLLTECP